MKNDMSQVLAAMEPQPLSQHLLAAKYAAPGEATHLDVYSRVARALAADQAQEQRFLRVMLDGFVPGGRINSSAGLDRKSTLINCFVQPVADTMTGSILGISHMR